MIASPFTALETGLVGSCSSLTSVLPHHVAHRFKNCGVAVREAACEIKRSTAM